MNIDLDFKDTYKFEAYNSELTEFVFNSPIVGGGLAEMKVIVQPAYNPFLQDYLNLAFPSHGTCLHVPFAS